MQTLDKKFNMVSWFFFERRQPSYSLEQNPNVTVIETHLGKIFSYRKYNSTCKSFLNREFLIYTNTNERFFKFNQPYE